MRYLVMFVGFLLCVPLAGAQELSPGQQACLVVDGTSLACVSAPATTPQPVAFRWTPTPDQVGSYTVTVCVSDGQAESCEDVTITVTAP